jgi:hypothetical protein
VPGKPASSELIRRILSRDPHVMMPTPESQLTLTDREKALLVRWIEQGAEWKDHWAFLPIEDPEVPSQIAGFAAPRTPVDAFVDRRLSEENIAPAPAPAEPEVLLRRLYFDLTGLPPSLDEIDAFLADPSEEAYAATVERLLGTDAYAERMAMEWMDVARYADSHGLHADGLRTSYPYRDWLISAFRRNLPYDDFIRYQVAGDLLDEPTYESRLATAFLRMHPITSEGGAIDEEYRLSYVFDRVNTVATGMLGLTMDCARCHDHKFDPLSQEEYYSFSAYFNNVDELGMTPNDGDSGPNMVVNSPETYAWLAHHQRAMDSLDRERRRIAPTKAELEQFVLKNSGGGSADFRLDFERVANNQVDGKSDASDGFTVVEDERRGRVGLFDHGYDLVNVGKQGRIQPYEQMSASLYVMTERREAGREQSLLCTAGNKEGDWRGMDFFLDDRNRLVISLAHLPPEDMIEVRTRDSLRVGEWYQVAFTYDGSGLAGGTKLYVNGIAADTEVLHDELTGSFYPSGCASWEGCKAKTMRVGRSYRTFTGDDGVFRGRMDDLRIYYRTLSPVEVAQKYGIAPPAEAVAATVLQHSEAYRMRSDSIRRRLREVLPLSDTAVTLMVMKEMERPRKTYLLERGAYDAPGKEVHAGTPAGIGPNSSDFAPNRAGLADWLLHPDNPLTARVAVNRYWQLFFGQGLVATPHDFGSQGNLPTHPELLDYLASRFREDWDLRELIRTIVLSNAYRRSSTPTDEQLAADPDNLWLARGPRHRLPAEMIRDNALASSGLLVDEVGGPSVKPYQPPGLWIEKSNFSNALLHYVPNHGDSLYRRSMYTFIRRTSAPPFLLNFDATGRDICVVKRSETNTPLQALNLLNDPQFVEAARVLAQRVQSEAGTEVDDQLRRAYRLVTGRRAAEREVQILRELYTDELDRFRAGEADAEALLATGEYALPQELDRPHTAALTSVANVLYSTDVAYVKY